MTSLLCALLLALAGAPDGGRMWLYDFVRDIHRTEMYGLGGRIDPVEIYSQNHYSYKDAVVKFSDGSVGGVISQDGLVVARRYQDCDAASKVEDDVREVPLPGMSVTFMVEMEDVSRVIERAGGRGEKSVQKAFEDLVEDAEARYRSCKAAVQDFGDGVYYLISYMTFRDIRLVVGPSTKNVGYSLFRVYADKKNAPSDFSEENKPYRPGKILKPAPTRIQDGDFRIQIGYPEHELMQVLSLGRSADKYESLVFDADGKLVGLTAGDSVVYIDNIDTLK